MSCNCGSCDDCCRELELITGQPGEDGTAGAQGAFGGNSDAWAFNAATAGNPTSGKLLFNNANLSAATAIHISDTDSASADLTAWLAAIGTSNSTIKAFVRIGKKTDSTKFALYAVTAVTQPAGYTILTVTYLASSSNSPFAAADPLVFSYDISGNTGSNGTDARTTLFNNLTQVNSGDTGGVTTLQETEDIPANTLVNNGDSVYVEVILQSLATVYSSLPFAVVNTNGSSLNTISFTSKFLTATLRMTIDRISSTSYLRSSTITVGSVTLLNYPTIVGAADFTLPITIDVLANTNTVNAGGIVCRKLFGEYKPA